MNFHDLSRSLQASIKMNPIQNTTLASYSDSYKDLLSSLGGFVPSDDLNMQNSLGLFTDYMKDNFNSTLSIGRSS